MAFFKNLRTESSMEEVIQHDMGRFQHLMGFTQAFMRGESGITVGERELIAAFTSGLNSCNFCYGMHSQTANQFGINLELLEAMLQDIETSDLSDQQKPLFQFIKKLTEDPSKMTEEDANRVYSVGYSEEELHDAVTICSLFNLFNRLLDGHGVKGNSEIFSKSSYFLSQYGYMGEPQKK